MYFVARGNKLYTFFIRLKPWQQYVATVSALFLISTSWYYCIYMPVQTCIESYQHRVSCAQNLYSTAQALQLKLEEQQKQLHRLKRKLSSKLVSYSNLNKIQSSVSILVHYAQQANLVLESCSCDNYEKKDWYKKSSLSINATGSLQEVVTFLNLLLESNQVYQCSSLELKHLNDSKLFHINCLLSEYTTID